MFQTSALRDLQIKTVHELDPEVGGTTLSTSQHSITSKLA